MKRSIFKSILVGALFGAAVYFIPFFLFKALFFFLIIGFIFRMIWWRGFRWGHRYHYQVQMADKIRSMSEDEYNALKNKMNDWNNWDHYNCGSKNYRRGYYGRGGCNDTWCDKGCDTPKEKTDSETTTTKS